MPYSDNWLPELFHGNQIVLVYEGKCFFTEKSQLINVEGMVELENHTCIP